MLHTFEQYSEHRVLPSGWKEHYDSQRNLWYYVDLSSDPPRISLVHPGEPKDQQDKPLTMSGVPSKPNKESLRLSPTQRPVGPRDSVSSANGSTHTSQRPRRATVAQQLYASSLSAIGKESTASASAQTCAQDGPKSAKTSSRRPSVSSTPMPEAINSPTSSANSLSSASSSGFVSPTSPISPMPGLDVHNPRNFLDCTRLTGTRRVTYSGPQPLLTPRNTGKSKLPPVIMANSEPGLGVDAFYHASVKTSPSPMPPRAATDPNTNNLSSPALSAPDNYQMKGTVYPSAGNSSSSSGSSSSLIKVNALSPRLPIPAEPHATSSTLTRRSPLGKGSSPSSRSPTLPQEAPKQDIRISGRPLPPTTKHTQLVAPLPPPPMIMQPKPMRPLGSVNLNLQVQVTGVNSESSPDQSADGSPLSAKKKLNPILKTFNLGITKNAKGKTPIRTIYDRQMFSSSPIADDLPAGAL